MSSKRMSMLIALASAFVLAIILCLFSVLKVKADSVDASIQNPFRFLSVESLDAAGGKVTFVVNKHLGKNPFDVTSLTTDKVSYSEADGGTRTLSKVSYSWNDFLPKLSFSFAEDTTGESGVEYAVGDSITISAGFSFKNWDGSDLGINVTQDYTVTYTQDGWVGTFLDSALTNITVTNRNPGGIDVDFGISGVSANQIVMDSAHWSDDNVAAWERISSYVEYNSDAEGNVFNRFWLSADGKLTVTKGDDSLHPQAGDYFVLKKGFVMWAYTGGPFMSYGTEGVSYVPVFAVNEDIGFLCDGTTWTRIVEAESAELANQAAIEDLRAGQSLKIEWTMNEGANEIPAYKSSDDTIATVDSTGKISCLKEGEVTITAVFKNFTKTITFTVGAELKVVSYDFSIKGAATRDGVQYLVEYVGEELDKEFAASRLTATPVYNDETTGIAFAVTADMITTEKYDNSVEGATAITVTKDGVSADVPVYAYQVETVDFISPERILSWDSAINLYFFDVVDDNQGESASVHTIDFRGKPEYGITNTMATLREPSSGEEVTHELYTVGEVTKIQCMLFFGAFDAGKQTGLAVGGVLTLHDNFRFYRNLDGTWVARYKFAGEVSYVWDGSAWHEYVGEATGFELSEQEVTLPNGATYTPEVKILPEGAYATPEMSSDEPAIVKVEDGNIVALAPGEANVTLTMGDTVKTIKVTVADTQIQGLKLANDRTFYVSQNGTFDVSKVKVLVDYGEGFYSSEIKLSSETATFTLDTSKVGKQQLVISCTVEDRGQTVQDEITVNIDVQGMTEMYPDNLTCNDDGAWSGTLILIYFQKTFPNTANVYPSKLSQEDAKTITDNISYLRDGASVDCENIGFLTNMLTFIPKIGGEAVATYQVGDTILLKKGLTFWKWFGETDEINMPTGEGDFVKVGELKYDVKIVYNEQHKFAWTIEPESGKILEESITVGLGEQHASNVAIVPEYATEGEWFFEVADETIASVNVNGLIKGLKQGTTQVTAVLKKLDGTVITTVSFTVVVEDSVASMEITSEKPVEVALGTDLDIGQWIEDFGIKGQIVYTSGAKGDEVDLSGARVTGYDPETAGEQTLTFRLTVDGKSITGTLTIKVGDAAKGGCSSSFGGTEILAAGIVTVGAAVVCLRKKKSA